MKKYILSLFLCFCLLVSFIPVARAENLPNINAEGFVLCNPQSGEILDAKNPDMRLYPASLTKMMTAILTAELAEDLDAQKVTVSQSAIDQLAGTHSSVANIQPGEIYTLRQMLYFLMVPSGNDAANVLAEHLCGSNTEFVKKMNKRAKELGMSNTHFANPHGLHDDNHYTTARDMALLAMAYLQNPDLKEICSASEYTSPATADQPARTVKTTNFLKIPENTYYYEYAYGLKTGNTDEAGRCLASAARKNGLELVCIMLKCPTLYTKTTSVRTEYTDTKAVFEYAFEHYEYRVVYPAGTLLDTDTVRRSFGKSVTLVTETDLYATLLKGADDSRLSIIAQRDPDDKTLTAPIKKGEAVGKAVVKRGGQVVAETRLIAAEEVKLNFLLRFWQAIDLYVYIFLGFVAALILLFAVLVIRAQIIRRRRRRRRRR